MNVVLNNIYFQQNQNVSGYVNLYLETSIGLFRLYVASLSFVDQVDLKSMHRISEIDHLKEKNGDLSIDEIRRTYDNDIYLLISGKLLFAIEYRLNSNSDHSVQEFRVIDDLNGRNKGELNDFKELDKIELPSSQL